MILYFSATGNSKYVAERIAAALGDRAVSIEVQRPEIALQEGEVLGIVTPTHWLEMPVITREFLENLNLKANNPYTFIVSTYGTTPGLSGSDCKHVLKKRGCQLCAAFSLRMPDNWTPMFDLSDPEDVQRQNDEAEVALEKLIHRIVAKEEGNNMDKKAPYFLFPLTNAFLKRERRTKNLYVEDSCIGCGLCERKCPVKAIEIKDDKPNWVKSHCVMCLRCLHSCPKFSIQYGDGKTKEHGQYKNPNTKI